MVCGEVQTLLGDRDVDVCPIQRRRTLHQLPAARQQNARGTVVRVLREHRDGSGEVAGGVRLEPPLGTPRIAPGYACNGRALADDVWSYLSRSRPCRSFRAFATVSSPPPKALPGWRPPWRGSRLAWSSVGTGWGKLHDLDKVTKFFTELGIPAPGFNAVLALTAEFVCGSLLLAGLFSRLASLPPIRHDDRRHRHRQARRPARHRRSPRLRRVDLRRPGGVDRRGRTRAISLDRLLQRVTSLPFLSTHLQRPASSGHGS